MLRLVDKQLIFLSIVYVAIVELNVCTGPEQAVWLVRFRLTTRCGLTIKAVPIQDFGFNSDTDTFILLPI